MTPRGSQLSCLNPVVTTAVYKYIAVPTAVSNIDTKFSNVLSEVITTVQYTFVVVDNRYWSTRFYPHLGYLYIMKQLYDLVPQQSTVIISKFNIILI